MSKFKWWNIGCKNAESPLKYIYVYIKYNKFNEKGKEYYWYENPHI